MLIFDKSCSMLKYEIKNRGVMKKNLSLTKKKYIKKIFMNSHNNISYNSSQFLIEHDATNLD